MRHCLGCGADVRPPDFRCMKCAREQRRLRRHPGYDHKLFRKVKREKRGRTCEVCGRVEGKVLHHNDGDAGHNVRRNYTWACVACARGLDNTMRAGRRARK